MPTSQQFRDCSEFLGRLTHLGTPLGNLRTLEDAYWALLKEPAPTPYDNTSPFSLNGAPDISRVSPILTELGASAFAPDATDCFWELAWWAGGNSPTGDRDDDARIKAGQMSVAALWSVAVVVFLALKAGVYESNKKELTSLVVEAAKV